MAKLWLGFRNFVLLLLLLPYINYFVVYIAYRLLRVDRAYTFLLRKTARKLYIMLAVRLRR